MAAGGDRDLPPVDVERVLDWLAESVRIYGEQVNHRIHRLEGALQRDDHEAIKWEAYETIGLLAQLMSHRREQHSAEMAGLAARLERMRGQLDSVREEAATDALTKLYNRAAFDEQLQRAVDFGSLFEKPSYLVMVDIDHFKWVNDNHGHPGGDEVLRQVANSLARSFLRRDDFVALYAAKEAGRDQLVVDPGGASGEAD